MYRLIAFLFCLLVSTASHAQTRLHVLDSFLSLNIPDTTKADNISSYAFFLSERNADTALVMARVAVQLATKAKDDETYATVMNNAGWVYYNALELDTAEQYMLTAVPIYQRMGKLRDLVRVYSNLAYVCDARQDAEAALNYLLKAAKIVGSRDTLSRAMIDRHIGIIYRRKGFKAQAKEYLLRAANDLRNQYPKLYADAAQSLGTAYFEYHEYDSAKRYYLIAADIFTRMGSNKGVSVAYEGMGVVFQGLAEQTHQARYLDSALYYYKTSYAYGLGVSDETEVAFMKMRLGDIYLLRKDYRSAETYLKDALGSFIKSRSIANIYAVAGTLGDVYAARDNYKEAYKYQVFAGKYKDTMAAEVRESEMADMLARYEAEKKDRTIALLNAQNSLLNTKKKLAENDLSKRRTTELFALVLILFAIGFAFVLMNRYRIKQRLHELEMRNRISNDLHDDVGSSLSSILLLSNIAKGEGANKSELLGRISENAAEVIERISDIVWTTNPTYDDGENLRSKIMNYIVPLCHAQGIALRANVSEAMKVISFSMDSRKNLFLIIKEAMNNILKHAQASEVTFDVFVKEQVLTVEIADNGRGFDRGSASIGNGLVTLQSRAEAMKGRLDVLSAPGTGTKVTVAIPISRSNYFTIKKLDGVYGS